MGSVSAYLFTPPQNGEYLGALVVLVVVVFMVALIAWVVAARSGYAVVRRRARKLRAICLGFAALGVIYLVARYRHVGVLELRVWLYLLLVVLATRLTGWVLTLKSLTHDKVEENQRKRKNIYFKKQRRQRPAKRRRRR